MASTCWDNTSVWDLSSVLRPKREMLHWSWGKTLSNQFYKKVLSLPLEWETKDYGEINLSVGSQCDSHSNGLSAMCPDLVSKALYYNWILRGNYRPCEIMYYTNRKCDLVLYCDTILANLEQYLKLVNPDLHHRDKTCKCWEWIAKHLQIYHRYERWLDKKIWRDYTKHPDCCYFIQIRKKYAEWLKFFIWFYDRVILKRRRRKPRRELWYGVSKCASIFAGNVE